MQNEKQQAHQTLTQEQRASLRSSITGRHAGRDYAIMLLLSEGVKIAEVTALDLEDFQDGQLHLGHRGENFRLILPDAVAKSVSDYILNERSNCSDSDQQALFLSGQKRRITASMIYNIVHASLAGSGLDAGTFLRVRSEKSPDAAAGAKKTAGTAQPLQRRDDPQILRDFLSYHETIKGQSARTIAEYRLDLRIFLRFMKLIKNEMPYDTPLEEISIRDVDLDFIRTISLSDIYDYLSYLANDRIIRTSAAGTPDYGIDAAARARKLSAVKAFYKYLTVRTKQLEENPVQDLEFPRVRKTLPRFLTLEQASSLLQAVHGRNEKRDYAILFIFLDCGIRISELVSLNLSDVYDDRLRVVGKGNKERIVYMGEPCADAIQDYILNERDDSEAVDRRPLFLSQQNRRISTAAVHSMIKKYLLEAGLDASQFSAHKLRHTAATLMLQNGVDVRTVQEVLGHENLNTTQIYTHIEDSALKIAAEANPISKIKK